VRVGYIFYVIIFTNIVAILNKLDVRDKNSNLVGLIL